MKKLILAVACISFIAFSTSCTKKCDCKEYDKDGKVVREYKEKQPKVLGVGTCEFLNEAGTDGSKTECK